MTARLRRQQRQNTEHASRWKFFLGLGVLISVISVLVGSTLLYKPWQVGCSTTLNTYCSESTQNIVSQLKEQPFWDAQRNYPNLKKTILEQHPNVADVSFRRTWLASVEVIVTEAESLFPIRWNTQNFSVRSNGSLTPNSAPSIPVMMIEEPVFSDNPPQILYTEDTLRLLATLYERLQTLSPTIQKIVVESQNEIIVSPEGYGPVYMRLGTAEELEEQLSTLQAFFHSTTMDKQYQVLDIRFRDVIMK